ncbi:TetR/AcrR family transcriptional regulator [Rubrolithibacter danxiaensis]|uniref:TetR/AcrR family transcriptional regulator n=1 Tax=Rubrolithibacter danxiaensis TaxID=3390805 RepID=UPI003BF927AD
MQQGIRKMSNNKLVALLGISTKTLYKHFKDKEDLLEQALELHYLQQHEVFENLYQGESAPVLLFYAWRQGFDMEFNINKTFFKDLHYYYPELEKKVEVRNAEKLWKELIQIVNKGKEEGHIMEDVIAEVVLEGMSILYVSAVRKGDFKKLRLSPNAILLNTLGVYLRGICTEKGIQALDKYLTDFDELNKKIPEKEGVIGR